MRKKQPGRKKQLLDCARRIGCTEGASAISIRRLAKEANIAVGTVYQYFDSKRELLLALIEEYWADALSKLNDATTSDRFPGQVRQMYLFLQAKMIECGATLMRNLRGDEKAARGKMTVVTAALRNMLEEQLRKDPAIRDGVWNESLTLEDFAQFVLTNLLALLQQKNGDPETLIEIIERVIY